MSRYRHTSLRPAPRGEEGHLLVALMVLIAVMLILLTVTGQSWTFLARRDAEICASGAPVGGSAERAGRR